MPSYYYHLKFELYSVPASSFTKRRKLVSAADRHNIIVPGLTKVYLPPHGSNIFKVALPAHKTGKWSDSEASSKADLQTPAFGNLHQSTSEHSHSTHDSSTLPARYADSYGDALLLPERSLRLKKDIPSSPRTAPSIKHSSEAAAKDWRYDSVQIESIDMDNSRVKTTTSGGLHTKAIYQPSDLKTTHVGWGVVHLYRDTEESAVLDENATLRSNWNRSAPGGSKGAFNAEDCTTLCILAVPLWMGPGDLLGFLGDQAREDVSHFRLIRTGRANKYMCLMKFRSAKKARDWQKANNGRLFSAVEPENCHVVFIQSVEFISPDSDVSAIDSFPRNTNDPFTSAPSSAFSKTLLTKPPAPPPPNLLELPTCPVCLERMDETTGLLTILCQHVFHCACLEKWRGSGCPVCRYTHSPSYTFPYPRPLNEASEDDPEPLCSVCAGTNNLWVCLICGNIGCGRYDDAHAFAHYEETSHCYAMDISTQHVWDYAGDGYVHRLIQSKPPPETGSRGGIDLPMRTRHANEAFRAEGSDSVPREKMENMAAEYTYLLTSQLEGQRRYFEEQMERLVNKAAEASARAEENASSSSRHATEIESFHTEQHRLKETVASLEKSLDKSEKARKKFEEMARDMMSQLREEKTMNEGLVKRIQAAEGKVEEARREVEEAKEGKKELEEMNRDLLMTISGQQRVQELQAQGEEVVDGTLIVPDPPAGGKKGKGKGRKK